MTDLRITSPCAADWNAMTPAAAGRHCAECGKDVIDLTCLTPDARETALKRLELAVARGRKVCVRAPAGHDGRLHGRSLRRRVLTGGMAGLLAMTVAGCQGEGPVATTAPQPTITTPVIAPTPGPIPTVEPTPAPEHLMMGGVAAPHQAPEHVIMGDVAEPPEPITMGKVAAVQPEPVKMGEMCIAPQPVPAPQPIPQPTVPAPAK